jgi:hypothetical protein
MSVSYQSLLGISEVTADNINIMGNLEVTGNTIIDGYLILPEGAGLDKVLTSDGTGTASWQSLDLTLAGDVSGPIGSNIVDLVGGKTKVQIAQSVDDTINATSANTINTIVKRDGNGDFSTSRINLSNRIIMTGGLGTNPTRDSGSGSVWLSGFNGIGNKQMWFGDPDYINNVSANFFRIVVFGGADLTLDAVSGDGSQRRTLTLGIDGDANSRIGIKCVPASGFDFDCLGHARIHYNLTCSSICNFNVVNSNTISNSSTASFGGIITAPRLNMGSTYITDGTLAFGLVVKNQILSFYTEDTSPNATQFYGFGINAGILRYQSPVSTNHVFYVGTSELMRINASGITAGTFNGALNGNATTATTATSTNGIRNITVTTTAPTNGQLLQYNSGLNELVYVNPYTLPTDITCNSLTASSSITSSGTLSVTGTSDLALLNCSSNVTVTGSITTNGGIFSNSSGNTFIGTTIMNTSNITTGNITTGNITTLNVTGTTTLTGQLNTNNNINITSTAGLYSPNAYISSNLTLMGINLPCYQETLSGAWADIFSPALSGTVKLERLGSRVIAYIGALYNNIDVTGSQAGYTVSVPWWARPNTGENYVTVGVCDLSDSVGYNAIGSVYLNRDFPPNWGLVIKRYSTFASGNSGGWKSFSVSWSVL